MFPLRGKGHRQRVNRVIVGSAATGLGLAGGIVALSYLPPALRRTSMERAWGPHAFTYDRPIEESACVPFS